VATPTQNFVPTTNYNPSVFGDSTDTMLDGTKWGGPLGTAVTLTYSFPQGGAATWVSPYSDDQEPDSWYVLEDYQMTGARQALATWAAVANVRFSEVADTDDSVGEIRFAFTDNMNPNSAAHAYMPSGDPTAGDIWFNLEDGYTQPTAGSFFYNTMIHEIGHALGLDHSFDLEPQYDNLFYSVMSYTASPWSEDGDNYASFYPTTPMYFDILALQAIYGTEGLTTNAGNTTYSYTGGTYFETIVDTGGKDTIVYSGSDTCTIDLNIGSFSALSQAIDFSSVISRHTVAIGPGTIIENAKGGAQNDRIDGNAARNNLQGNGGRDTIYGGSGNDTLVGGKGYDRLQGNSGNDCFDFNALAEIGRKSHDIVMDFRPGQDDIDLSTLDANTLRSGNNKFSFTARADSSLNGKAGELCWYKQGGKTFVIGDTDGNRSADFMLELTGSKTLTVGDFIL
jgi:Ca2+-binding RTX toxin-like protein